jgi:hypothetical protein
VLYGQGGTNQRTTIYLSDDQRARVDQFADRHRITMAEVVRRAPDEFLRPDDDLDASFGAARGLRSLVPSRDEWDRTMPYKVVAPEGSSTTSSSTAIHGFSYPAAAEPMPQTGGAIIHAQQLVPSRSATYVPTLPIRPAADQADSALLVRLAIRPTRRRRQVRRRVEETGPRPHRHRRSP